MSQALGQSCCPVRSRGACAMGGVQAAGRASAHASTCARAVRQLGHEHVLVVAVGDRDLEVSAEELAWWVGCLPVCGTGGLRLQRGAVSQKPCQHKQQPACCAGPVGASAWPRGSHRPSVEVRGMQAFP